MDPFSRLTEALTGLVALPFLVAGRLWRLTVGLARLRQRWHATPLQTKSHVRSGAGAAGLALCASFSSWLLALANGPMILAGSAGLALLYVLGGAFASRYPRLDSIFSVFWFGVGAFACVVFLIFGEIPGLSWLLN